jgi:hypothetical protein
VRVALPSRTITRNERNKRPFLGFFISERRRAGGSAFTHTETKHHRLRWLFCLCAGK